MSLKIISHSRCLCASVTLINFVVFATSAAQVRAPRPNRLETIRLESKLTGRTLPYIAILPPGYHDSTSTRYPVLYLLHGLSGHYSDWTTRTNVADYAAQYPLIIITPEGNDSWYIDSAIAPSEKYESYILNELIPDVDARYRTIQSRYGRAIAGLSMGGYGSIKFGMKHPQIFVFAASMSGAFGVTRGTQQDRGAGWDVKLFGAPGSPGFKANDLFDLTRNLPVQQVLALPYFYFDCGTEDNSSIFNANRDLSELFAQKKIPHEYRELPGDHSWGYWDQQVQEVLKIATQKLRLPRPKLPTSQARQERR